MNWRDQAACLNTRPDLWYPSGESEEEEDAAEEANLPEARAICDRCPALILCGQAARNEPHGIQAGTTGARRRRVQ